MYKIYKKINDFIIKTKLMMFTREKTHNTNLQITFTIKWTTNHRLKTSEYNLIMEHNKTKYKKTININFIIIQFSFSAMQFE